MTSSLSRAADIAEEGNGNDAWDARCDNNIGVEEQFDPLDENADLCAEDVDQLIPPLLVSISLRSLGCGCVVELWYE